MDGYVTLLGTETVQRAAREISSAADRMSRAASEITHAVDRLERVLEQDRQARDMARS